MNRSEVDEWPFLRGTRWAVYATDRHRYVGQYAATATEARIIRDAFIVDGLVAHVCAPDPIDVDRLWVARRAAQEQLQDVMDQFRAAVFTLLAQGVTEKDAAEHLGIARGTVRAWEGK